MKVKKSSISKYWNIHKINQKRIGKTEKLKFFKECSFMHSILGRGSFSTNSSFSPLFVKLSQVFESVLIDSILKLTVIPVACAPFRTQFLPSSQLCI